MLLVCAAGNAVSGAAAGKQGPAVGARPLLFPFGAFDPVASRDSSAGLRPEHSREAKLWLSKSDESVREWPPALQSAVICANMLGVTVGTGCTIISFGALVFLSFRYINAFLKDSLFMCRDPFPVSRLGRGIKDA